MRWFTSRVRRFSQWVKGQPRKFTIPITVIILIAISFGTYQAVGFYDYMQHDPEFCLTCHLMDEPFDLWATSVHQDVECHGCHRQSMLVSAQEGIKAILGADEIEGHAEIPDEICEECHRSEDPLMWQIQIAHTAGHIIHSDKVNIDCQQCHSPSVHRFKPVNSLCQQCHTKELAEGSAMTGIPCYTCHDFTVESNRLLPVRKFCLSCHTVDGLHLEGLHGTQYCQTCHKVHESLTIERETCTSCHSDKVEHNADKVCDYCHKFRAQ